MSCEILSSSCEERSGTGFAIRPWGGSSPYRILGLPCLVRLRAWLPVIIETRAYIRFGLATHIATPDNHLYRLTLSR